MADNTAPQKTTDKTTEGKDSTNVAGREGKGRTSPPTPTPSQLSFPLTPRPQSA